MMNIHEKMAEIAKKHPEKIKLYGGSDVQPLNLKDLNLKDLNLKEKENDAIE
jgi:hypothetical protein